MPIPVSQIFQKSKSYRALVLVDRDGTLIKDNGYETSFRKLEMLPTVVEGIRLLNLNNIGVIVITNQPAVGNGYLEIEDLIRTNSQVYKLLSKKNAYISAIYSCPHHPNAKIELFKMKCKCRKPNTKMLDQALKDFGIHQILGVIGDTTRDIKMGKNAQITTVGLETGRKLNDMNYRVRPDYKEKTFIEGVIRLIDRL